MNNKWGRDELEVKVDEQRVMSNHHEGIDEAKSDELFVWCDEI